MQLQRWKNTPVFLRLHVKPSCNVKELASAVSQPWAWLPGQSYSHSSASSLVSSATKWNHVSFPGECMVPQISYRTGTSCCGVLFCLSVQFSIELNYVAFFFVSETTIRWGDYCWKREIPLPVSLWKMKSATSVSRKSFFSSHWWQGLHFFTRTSWCGIS